MARRGVILDAHHHLWAPARGDYGWLTPDLTALYRDYLPPDLDPLLAANGIDGTVIVQAAPTLAETRFLLELARRWPKARAVVGWVDMTAADAPDVLAGLAADRMLRGIRPMVQDEPDPEWMLQDPVVRAFAALGDSGLTFDALVRPGQLRTLARLVDQHAHVPVVIDHAAKPGIEAGAFQPWADDIRALSERPQVMCKLSGLLTEAGPRTADADLQPYVDHLLACFGPERLMWGSDWPVLNLAGDYAGWLEQARRLVQRLGADEQAQIFGRTAQRFYGLKETP
jgi:L-fuconolactonase